MTRPKWSKEKERVYRAAMRWFRARSMQGLPGVYRIPVEEHLWSSSHVLHKACATLSKRRKK